MRKAQACKEHKGLKLMEDNAVSLTELHVFDHVFPLCFRPKNASFNRFSEFINSLLIQARKLEESWYV